MKNIVPYKESEGSKKEQVQKMFDSISRKYDLLNHLLSFGIDYGWRKKVVSLIAKTSPEKILDIATGTADLAIALVKTKANKITGSDISSGMLEIGRAKIEKLHLNEKINLIQADAENLPFVDDEFDAVTAAFGVRNFENLEKGLTEMYRVLKKHGTVAILEFSQPEKFPIKPLYFFYFKNILPLIGKMISKESNAYTYLPESVSAFPYGTAMLDKMKNAGFRDTTQKKLTFGIASIYIAKK